jgi:hypothetical protein
VAYGRCSGIFGPGAWASHVGAASASTRRCPSVVPLPSSWNEVLFLLALVWSLFVYAAAATCAAGLAGNLISALTRGGGIPDPFVLGGAAHGIPFNPADVFFLLGLSGLIAAALQSGTSSVRK